MKLLDLIMYPLAMLLLVVLGAAMLLTCIPLIPFAILATPAAIANDSSPRNRRPWNELTGWKRVTMAPYLACHKFIVEKIWRQKQRFMQ